MAARLAELVLALPKDSRGSYSSVLEHCLYLYLNKQPDMVAFLPLTYKPYLLSETFYTEFEAFEPVMFPEYQGNAGEGSTRYFTSQIRQLATYDGEWLNPRTFRTMQTRNTIAWSQFTVLLNQQPELLPYVEKECSAEDIRIYPHPPKPVQDIETLFSYYDVFLAMFVKAIGLRTVGTSLETLAYPRDWKLDGLKAGVELGDRIKDIETTFVRRFYDSERAWTGGDTLLTPNEYRTFLTPQIAETIRLCTVRTLHYVPRMSNNKIATYQIRYTMLYENFFVAPIGDHRHGLFNITAVKTFELTGTSTLVASITPNEGVVNLSLRVNAPLDRTQDEQRNDPKTMFDTQNDSPTQQLLKMQYNEGSEWPVDFYHALSGRITIPTRTTVTDFDRIPKQYLQPEIPIINKPQDGVKEASNLAEEPIMLKANKRGDTKFVPVESRSSIAVSC
ncbi:hypothetical protein SPFM9_00229 [Salmonella phage SPFM9]|nr:hypothetical protein SPFM9_00229 [Salmonella phage SPFM9]